jgi:Bacterial PH domain
MTFRSKIDAWLALVLGTALAAILFAAYSTATRAAGPEWIQSIIMVSVGLGLILWPLVSTNYSVGADNLLIRSGPFRWQVPLSTITKITPTRSPISSPALSLDRLRIDYGVGKVVLVSPLNQQAFIKAIGTAKSEA